MVREVGGERVQIRSVSGCHIGGSPEVAMFSAVRGWECSVKTFKDRSALDVSSKKEKAGGEIAKEIEETTVSHITRPQV